MAAKKRSGKPVKKSTRSRTAGKRGTGKKKAGRKRSPPGMLRKAKHMVGAVLMGAATGAVKGALEAGGKEMGIPKESENKGSLPKGKAKESDNDEPKNRK